MARLAQGEGEKMKFFLSQKSEISKKEPVTIAPTVTTDGAEVGRLSRLARLSRPLPGKRTFQRQPFALASQFEATTLVKSH